MEWTRRNLAGLGGLVAAGLALGLGELFAAPFDAVPSPLVAVGNVVVDNVPGAVERWAISVFGTADKAALAIGTVIIGLIVGWLTGVAALRRLWVAFVVFGLFALAGIAAGWGEPGARPLPLIAATLASAASGAALLTAMLGAIHRSERADPDDTTAADAGRRRFLALAGAGGVAAVGAGVIGRKVLAPPLAPPDVDLVVPSSPVLGPEFEFGTDGLSPVVTPISDFYRIDTALAIPSIDPDTWQLRIHGQVDREVTIDYADLTSAELMNRYVTIACVSNRVGGGLVGNARWTGVPLAGFLEEAGVERTGTQVVGRSRDGWTSGFPIEAVFDGREPLIAVGMNGEVLPRRHGFPARLIVPGLYGYVSATKWITEIEITGWDDFDGYWIPRGWAKRAPIKTQSRIDLPRDRTTVAGPVVDIAGVAWAVGRGISAVEVSLDEGQWQPAEVSKPLSDDTWVQWQIRVEAPAGPHTVSVRATDGDGVVQTDVVQSPAPDGATGHHTIRFTSN